jgi:hypothetical protein
LPGLFSCRRIIGRQFLDFEFNQPERTLGGFRIKCRNSGDRLAPVAHALTGQRVFIHRDREHTIGEWAVIAGDDRNHPVKRPSLGDVQPNDPCVAVGIAKNASDHSIVMLQVGSVTRAAGYLFDAVDERNTPPLCQRFGDCVHEAAPAAIFTDSIIFA